MGFAFKKLPSHLETLWELSERLRTTESVLLGELSGATGSGGKSKLTSGPFGLEGDNIPLYFVGAKCFGRL